MPHPAIVYCWAGHQTRDRAGTDELAFRSFTAANTGESSEAALTDNAASRLTSNILRHLLEGFSAKDKNVRFRSVQFVATLINGLGELECVPSTLSCVA